MGERGTRDEGEGDKGKVQYTDAKPRELSAGARVGAMLQHVQVENGGMESKNERVKTLA